MKQVAEPIVRAPILAIMIFQVAALFARAYLEIRLMDGGEPKPFAQDLSYLVVPPILIILMYPILRRHWSFLRALLRKQDLTIKLIALSVLLGFTLRVSFWGGLISFTSFGVLRSSDPDAVTGPVVSLGCPDPGVLALSFLVVSFLIPVIEEIVNRGLILQSLLHHGRVIAVLLTSVLFAVMHDPQAILVSFIGGLFFAALMLKYNTLWAPMIAHATYNGVAVLDWECVSGQWNPTQTTSEIPVVGIIGSAVFVVGLLSSILLIRNREHRGTEVPR